MESPVAASDYYEALAILHEALVPRTYLEIGVATGESLLLAQAHTLCVGVDPEPMPDEHPARHLPNAVIFEETSDTFFAIRDLNAVLRGDPLDFAFIDGMHLFEYSLRDLINIEANSHAGTVVAVHDCLPIDAVTSSRERTTVTWTGDVWKLVACLQKYRPDLDVAIADASPSGLCIISGLDKRSTVLSGLYEVLLDEYVPLGWDYHETEMASTFAKLTVSVDEAIDRVSHMRSRGWSSTLVKLRWLAATGAATEARLSEAQAENEAVRAELAAARTKVAQLRAELAARAAQLNDIFASTSWRLSAPVRVAGRQAGRLSRSARSDRVRREAGKLARRVAPGLMRRRDRRLAVPRQEAGRPHSQSDPLLLAAEARQLEYRPTISVLVPVYDTPAKYLRLAVDSVVAQAYPEWELILCDDGSTEAETRTALEEIAQLDSRIHVHSLGANRGIAVATNAALAIARGEFVAMLDHDDELLPAALLEVVKALNADRTLDVVYTDQDYVEADGTVAQTFHKPDWSLEMFRGVMYVGHLLVVRRSLADHIGGFDPAFDNVQDFEFMLRLAENTERIAHVPEILYHWRKIPGSVAFGGNEKRNIEPLQAAAVNAHLARCGSAAVTRSNPEHAHRLLIAPKPRTRHPLISVVVRASGVEAHLEACCERIIASGSYPQREVIVTGGDISGDLERRLEAMGVILVASGESGSAAGVAGLERAGGDLFVSMAGDLEIDTPDWLEHLLFDCELPRVACVAPLILSPDGTVASAGLILGGEESVVPAMHGWQPGTDGYAGSLSCVREVSAVPGDCYAVTRRVSDDLGGLNPFYATDYYQAVDLSIRAFSKGLRNLCTPRVLARHREPALSDAQRDALDGLLLADAWEPVIGRGDPFHNRNFEQVAPGPRA